MASPSAFNVQSAQAIILFGGGHKNLWNGIVHDTLEAIVPTDAFQQTAEKLQLFANANGTVLFFENQEAMDQLNFGGIAAPAGEQQRKPASERVRVVR